MSEETQVYASGSESTTYKAFTFKAVILGLAMGLVWVIANISMAIIGGYSWTGESAAAMMIVTYVLFSLLEKLGVKSRPEEYGVVYGITEASCCAALGYQYTYPHIVYVMANKQFKDLWELFPSYMAPTSREVMRTAVFGGPIDWGAWAKPLAFYMILGIMIFLFSIFIVLPFRKQVVEIERVPFPVATVAAATVRLTVGKEHPERLKWLWLGLLIGFLIAIIQEESLIQTIMPEFPGVPISKDLTPKLQGFLPGAALYLTGFTPDLLAWAYIIPSEVQLTTFITGFIFYMIIAPLEVKMKKITYVPGGGFGTYVGTAIKEGLGFYWFGDGVYLAAGLIPIIVAYKYLINTWKRAIKGPTPEEKEEEPLPYRYTWIILILLSIGIIAVFWHMGLPPLIGLFMLFIQGSYFHAYMRSIGMGDWMTTHGYQMRAIYDAVFFRTGIYNPKGKIGAMTGVCNTLLTDAGAAGGVAAMETFRFAFLAKMKPRDMFISQILGMLMFFTGGLIFVLWLMHKYGGITPPFNFMTWGGDYYAYVARASQEGIFLGVAYSKLWSLVLGFIVATITIIAKIVLPWLPINVFGLVFGILLPAYYALYLFVFIAKWLTLRFFGSKGYEGVAIPFLAGFACGGVISTIYTAICTVLRELGYGIYTTIGWILIVITLVPAIITTIRTFTKKA